MKRCRKIRSFFFLVWFFNSVFLLHLIFDENVFNFRRECCIAEEFQKHMKLNNDKKVKNSSTLRSFRLLEITPLTAQNSKNSNRKTFLQIKTYQMQGWWKNLCQKLTEKLVFLYWGLSTLLSFFGVYLLTRFQGKHYHSSFSYWTVLFNLIAVAWVPDGELHAPFYRNIWFRKHRCV